MAQTYITINKNKILFSIPDTNIQICEFYKENGNWKYYTSIVFNDSILYLN